MSVEKEEILTCFESILVLKFAVKEFLSCWKPVGGRQSKPSAHTTALLAKQLNYLCNT